VLSDKKFIDSATEYIFNITEILSKGLSSNDFKKSLGLAPGVKTNTIQTLLNEELNKLNLLFSKRFNIGIDIKPTNSLKTSIAFVILPPINNEVLSLLTSKYQEFLPDNEKGVLSNYTTTTIEKGVINVLKEIRDVLQRGKTIVVDIEKRVILGLNKSLFFIRADFLRMYNSGLKPKEILSVLLHEVGHIFYYLKYINHTTNSNLNLIETFLNNFGNINNPIKSLEITLDKIEPDAKRAVTVVEKLNIYMLKSTRLNPRSSSFVKDQERLADKFVADFGLGGDLATALTKLSLNSSSLVNIDIDNEITAQLSTNKKIITVINELFTVLIVAVPLLLLGLMFTGLLVLISISILGYYLLTGIVKIIAYILKNIFSWLFTNNETDVKTFYDTLDVRLDKLRKTLISNLRTLNKDLSKEEKTYIISNIEKIDKTLAFVKKLSYKISKDLTKGFSSNSEVEISERLEKMLGSLIDNNFYLNSTKFDLINL